MTTKGLWSGLAACAALACIGTALEAQTAMLCQAGKNREAGKYAYCRQRAEGLMVTSGDAAKYTDAIAKCDTKFSRNWAKLERKATDAGTTCPTTGDQAAVQSLVTSDATVVAGALGGVRFVDNADGTVSDTRTGLMWEKKDGAGGGANFSDPHDVDNTYSWTSSGTAPDGPAFTDFLARLNAGTSTVDDNGNTVTGCFADRCDWRLPTIVELQTILSASSPCIDPVFGPLPSVVPAYWSSTTVTEDPSTAWLVDFDYCYVDLDDKTSNLDLYVRAVRGGW